MLRGLPASARRFGRRDVALVAALLAFSYFVILGEAGQRDPHPIIRILNALAAGTVVLLYLVLAPKRADRIDRGILLALLFYAAAAVLAQFPRQAFDALLAAFLFAAALFVARDLLAGEIARVAFTRCLMCLSALLVFLTTARWLLPALEWWSLTGWSVIPPLNLNLSATPWGHRHDLTLLLVMLYPSWWIGRIRPLRAAMATVVGILMLLIVVVDGSRNLWLVIAVASAALLVPFAVRHRPRYPMRQIVVGLALLAGAAAVALSGIGGSALERLLTAASIEARLAMWDSLIGAWLSRPIAGYGPGSFPWVLQQTDYFQTHSFAPRHPDSAVFQQLAEAGLLGALALVTVVASLLPAISRGRSRAALWVLITFALAGLGANPTDFGFLVAVAISWVAFAIPHEVDGPVTAPVGPRFLRLATLLCLAIVAVAWTATAAADVSYHSARTAITGARLGEAVPGLEAAARLDPGMALYQRQLGTVRFLNHDVPASISNLEEAVRLNPSDDLAWRALALARAASGDTDSAWDALGRAIDTQRSDPTNLLLKAHWQTEDGDHERALATLGEIVQAWPEIVAAPGWSELLPPGISTLDVVGVAQDRWSQDLPSPEPRSLQPTLLALMAGQIPEAEALAKDALGPLLGPAYVAVMGCDPAAPRLLGEVPDQARRTSMYWSLVARWSALEGRLDEHAVRLIQIMTDGSLLSTSADRTLNPLNENGAAGYSADVWGYRRTPVAWPQADPSLPSSMAGVTRWLLEPRDAVHSAGLNTVLRTCQ